MAIIQKLSKIIPDELYLRIKFLKHCGKRLDLRNPKTFGEKIQWLKLYDRKSQYTRMVDKITAKEYAASIIGDEYIIPTIGVWDNASFIDWNSMPNQFVLKCNNNANGLVICKDKEKLDIQATIEYLNRALNRNGFWYGREWPYKNVKPRILAEIYMEDDSGSDLRDYKFYCFNGEPKYCQVISDRSTNETIDFFDMDWVHQEFTGLGPRNNPYKNSKLLISRVKSLSEMISAATKLSEGMPFVRVDFYDVNGKMYFGELTFYPASGFGVFSPDEWNDILGNMIQLPIKHKDTFR